MPDELPEGQIQMSNKWANMGTTPARATTRRRAASATAPAEEVVEEEVVDTGPDVSTDDGE